MRRVKHSAEIGSPCAASGAMSLGLEMRCLGHAQQHRRDSVAPDVNTMQ